MTANPDITAAALAYASWGWPIVPLNGKRPIPKDWPAVASTDKAQILAWLQKWPDANIGIAAGPRAGFFVLDVDGPIGEESLAKLVAQHGALPATLEGRTGGGGRHILFRYPKGVEKLGNRKKPLGVPKLDVRGAGGQIVVPPSVHPETGVVYEWASDPEETEIAAAPAWLIELLTREDDEPAPARPASITNIGDERARRYGLAVLEAEARDMRECSEGGRNNQLNHSAFKVAQLAAATGITAAAAEAVLLEAAKASGLAISEARATFRSGWKSGLSKPRHVPESTRGAAAPAPPPEPAHDDLVDEYEARLEEEAQADDAGGGEGNFYTLEDEDHTELGMSIRFARLYADEVKWCDAFEWMAWDGRRWAMDKGGPQERVTAMVLDIRREARQMYDHAAELLEQGEIEKGAEKRKAADKLFKAAKELSKNSKIKGILALASSKPSVRGRVHAFDRDPWAFNVLNGTIDLRTGVLHPHDRARLITKIAPIAFDPDATCPTWDRFLLEVMNGRPELVHFLQLAIGYSLTGSTSEQCFFICWGKGSNGKSVLMNVILELLGDYAKETQAETLMLKRQENAINNDVADLAGARFVSANETEENQRLAEAKVKGLTGGDRVKARFLHKEFFEFTPEFKLWLRTNHKPVIRGTDDGIWRRIKMVPFEASFKGREDKALPAKLRAELPGILTWAVRGCLAWQQQGGLGEPAAVKAAVDDYRKESDVLADFVADLEPKEYRAGELFNAYREWCNDNGERATLNQKTFGARLTEMGWGRRVGSGNARIRIHPAFMGRIVPLTVNGGEGISHVSSLSTFEDPMRKNQENGYTPLTVSNELEEGDA